MEERIKRTVIAFLLAIAICATATRFISAPPPQETNHVTQRFTEAARSTIAAAQVKAQQTQCADVGTELLLWAIVSDEEGDGAKLLREFGVSIDEMRSEIEANLVWSTDNATQEDALPKLGQGARLVLALAASEVLLQRRDNPDIGSQHLLLGLLRYKENLPLSYTVLRKANVTLEKARKHAVQLEDR